MSEVRGTYCAGWIKGLGPKVLEAFNQADQNYSLGIDSALGVETNKATRLFKERSTDGARETIITKTGLPYAEETTENGAYNNDERVSSYQVQLNPVKKTQGVTISEEFQSDRDADVQSKLDEMSDLKVAMMMTEDRDAFSILTHAFTAQASLPNHLSFYADAVPFASTLHPIKATTTSNTTQSNASATGLVLNETNLETGRQSLRTQTDDRDLIMNIGSGREIIVVPTDLEKTAMIITKSTKRNGTANNDMNIYDGIMTVISTKLIGTQNSINGVAGTATNWFLFDANKSPLLFLNREGFKSRIWENNTNKDITVDGMMRYQVGNRDFRGMWASKGDGASYSS